MTRTTWLAELKRRTRLTNEVAKITAQLHGISLWERQPRIMVKGRLIEKGWKWELFRKEARARLKARDWKVDE
jgi:hypothetical protein